MPDKYFLNCATILVDKGDHNDRYDRGDELADVPEGAMDTLIRRGLAVAREDLEDVEIESPIEIAVEVEDPTELNEIETVEEVVEQTDWIETPVTDMDFPADVMAALGGAGLLTVKDILDYGSEHDSLTTIKGIGQATEKKIQVAIGALQE